MSDFEVRGADKFLRVSKALKQAGDKEGRKALNKGLRDAAKPIIKAQRAAAATELPHRGGLAAQVAKEPIRTQVRTGKDPGVRIVVGRRRGGARGADQGTIRHPVYGNRQVWVNQRVTPGWFTKTGIEQAPTVVREMERHVDDMAKRIAREAR